MSSSCFTVESIIILVSPATGENKPSALVTSPELESGASPKRSVMAMSMSMESKSSSIGLSAVLPTFPSTCILASLCSVSETVRSMSTVGSSTALDDANAAINSGGNSLGPTGRADLGARVTGEARPVENNDASSAVMRRAVEDRSSLSGNAGR